MHSINPLRHALAASAIRHCSLVLAVAAVIAAGTAQAGTIILDTFTSGSWALGRTPDGADLPSSKWTGPEGYWGGELPTVIDSGKLKLFVDGGYTLSLASNGGYTYPTLLRVSADLTVNGLSGTANNDPAQPRGLTIGLSTAQVNANDLYKYVVGLDLRENGSLNLFDQGATIASVAWTGGTAFDRTQSYHLSYDVDTSSGQISNISLAGSTANYATLQVARPHLVGAQYAAVDFNSNAGGSTHYGYLDNFKMEEVTTEVSTSLTLEASGNPSLKGSSVTFTATVQAGGVTATGAGGTVVFKDGSTTLDTITVSSGVATCSTSALAAGSHPITAEYSGVTGSFGSSSSSVLNQLVTGPAAVLVFTTAPNNAYAGSAFGTQPVVKTQDAYGNDSTFGLAASEIVTLAIKSGTGTLGGTFTYDIGTAAGNGTITGSGLSIDTAGSFTLGATSANLTEGESASFTVQAADANRLLNPSFYGSAQYWALSGVMYEDNDTVPGGQDSLKRCIRMYSSGGTLTQTVTLPAGNFTLTGWFATNTSGNTVVFELRDSGNVAVTPRAFTSPVIPVQPNWVQWQRNYTGLAAGSYTVYVHSSDNAVWADNFNMVPRGAIGTECDLVSFDYGTSIGVITPGSPNTVLLTVPFSAPSLATLIPAVTVSDYANFTPSGAQDFTSSQTVPVAYTVTSEDGNASKVYQVTVIRAAASTACDMVSFTAAGVSGVITPGTPNTVVVTLPPGTPVSALTPSVGVSAAASFTPSGAQDFTNSATTPVSYTVTAEDGIASKVYQVTVIAGAGYGAWATLQGLTGTSGDGSNVDPAFTADPNMDGIQNGMAWILGADALGNPAANRLKLPAVSWDGTGALILTFERLNASAANAALVVQYGDNLGATPWTNFTVGTSAGTTTDGNISIAVALGGGTTSDYDKVTVTIPATYMAAHSKTFARLMATSTATTPPPPIDSATLAQWSAPYRHWYYQPHHVIPSAPNIPGYESFQNTDVPTVYQLPGDTGKWYMSFIAFNGNGYNSFVAESTDLVNWSNPRLAMGFGQPGSFDYGGCVIGAYLYESYDIKAARLLKQRDGKYWTLYGAYPFQTGYESRPGYEGVASSADGLTWQQAKSTPTLSIYDPDCGTWEQSCIYQPWLVENNGSYSDFYNAANGGIEQSGLATSTDLLNWTRYPGNPVVKNASSTYDTGMASDPKVFRDGDHWTMFYFGLGNGGAHIMAAFSYDLMNWKASTVPLYLAGGNPSGLDSTYAHKISLVYNPQNDTYYMYYCAVGNAGRGIGLITSKPLPSN